MEMLTSARPSLLTLFRSLTSDTKTLIRQEIQLAKTELSEKFSRMGKNVAMVAVGGFVAYAGVIVFLIGLGWLVAWGLAAAGLNPNLARFIGIAVVGLLVAVVGYVMLNKALKALKAESITPEKTVQTLQEMKGTAPIAATAEVPEDGTREEMSSSQLQERVEATETRMGDTLEELGYRLSPQVIKERVKDNISSNPYRAGLVAMGFGLVSGLLLRRRFAH